MYVSDLALDDFRSYAQVVVSFNPGVNVFIGKNGQGKTNIVESLAYLSTLSPIRSGTTASLLRQAPMGQTQGNGAVIRAKVNISGRSRLLELEIVQGRANRARINRSPVRPRELLGQFHTVMFCPEDLQILRGDPGVRRKFLDEIMIHQYPTMAPVRAEYDKILRQRTALLKVGRSGASSGFLDSLEIWNLQLAHTAAKIIAARVRALNSIRSLVQAAHTKLAPDSAALTINYVCQTIPNSSADPSLGTDSEREELLDEEDVTKQILEHLQQRQREELARGVNLVGAHRDELELKIGPLPVRGYASHGQTWSCALALRIGCFDFFAAQGQVPVLILDDVFAELDKSRRSALLALIERSEQVFITAAVSEDIPKELNFTSYQVQLDSLGNSQIFRQDQQ